jgi:hypothetical protein
MAARNGVPNRVNRLFGRLRKCALEKDESRKVVSQLLSRLSGAECYGTLILSDDEAVNAFGVQAHVSSEHGAGHVRQLCLLVGLASSMGRASRGSARRSSGHASRRDRLLLRALN